MSEQKLKIIFHDGTLDGDSGFYCPFDSLPYKEGADWEKLRLRFLKKKAKEICGATDKEAMEDVKEYEPKGAWIVTAKDYKTISAVQRQCTTDGEVYLLNYTAKKLAKKLAVKHIGKRAK